MAEECPCNNKRGEDEKLGRSGVTGGWVDFNDEKYFKIAKECP